MLEGVSQRALGGLCGGSGGAVQGDPRGARTARARCQRSVGRGGFGVGAFGSNARGVRPGPAPVDGRERLRTATGGVAVVLGAFVRRDACRLGRLPRALVGIVVGCRHVSWWGALWARASGAPHRLHACTTTMAPIAVRSPADAPTGARAPRSSTSARDTCSSPAASAGVRSFVLDLSGDRVRAGGRRRARVPSPNGTVPGRAPRGPRTGRSPGFQQRHHVRIVRVQSTSLTVHHP